jgi:hypothetical protein
MEEIPNMKKILLLSWALTGLFSCFTLAQTTPGATATGANGIEGTISAGPTRGGPVRAGEPSSAPMGNMSFLVKQSDRVVTSFQTDEQGHFQVLLDPGHYTIVRKDYAGAVGNYGPFEVDVNPGKMTIVNWSCDTGLR